MFPWFAELGPTSSQAPVGFSRLFPALQTHHQSVLPSWVFLWAKWRKESLSHKPRNIWGREFPRNIDGVKSRKKTPINFGWGTFFFFFGYFQNPFSILPAIPGSGWSAPVAAGEGCTLLHCHLMVRQIWSGATSLALFWQWQEGIEQKWPEKLLSPVSES